MPYPIKDIEGIGPSYATKLAKAKITSTGHFLRLCCDKKGRKEVAKATGVNEKMLLKWANLADLMRIKGVATQYSELLEAAGVDTVKELRNRKPAALAEKMAQVNAKKRLTRTVPSETVVTGWISHAKRLTPKITH